MINQPIAETGTAGVSMFGGQNPKAHYPGAIIFGSPSVGKTSGPAISLIRELAESGYQGLILAHNDDAPMLAAALRDFGVPAERIALLDDLKGLSLYDGLSPAAIGLAFKNHRNDVSDAFFQEKAGLFVEMAAALLVETGCKVTTDALLKVIASAPRSHAAFVAEAERFKADPLAVGDCVARTMTLAARDPESAVVKHWEHDFPSESWRQQDGYYGDVHLQLTKLLSIEMKNPVSEPFKRTAGMFIVLPSFRFMHTFGEAGRLATNLLLLSYEGKTEGRTPRFVYAGYAPYFAKNLLHLSATKSAPTIIAEADVLAGVDVAARTGALGRLASVLPTKVFCCNSHFATNDFSTRLVGYETAEDGVLPKPILHPATFARLRSMHQGACEAIVVDTRDHWEGKPPYLRVSFASSFIPKRGATPVPGEPFSP